MVHMGPTEVGRDACEVEAEISVPVDLRATTNAWLNIELVSPWRSAGVPRHIAAAEVAGNEYFNPVVPEDLASRMRSLAGSD